MKLDPTSRPEVFTVAEAAQLLRIGRSCAHALARRYRTTGGREGLPVIEIGRSLRVPRAAIDRLLAGPELTDSEQEDSPSIREAS